MFEIQTTEPGELKRIAAAGTGALLVGLAIVGINLIAPGFTEANYTTENLVFGLFGLFVVVLATHPTYQAALKLDES